MEAKEIRYVYNKEMTSDLKQHMQKCALECEFTHNSIPAPLCLAFDASHQAQPAIHGGFFKDFP